MTVGTARKYNPGFLTDDELVASFCIRTNEFKSMVEMLRACTGGSNPHQIVIGPRGSGKTSLLLRIAAEVRRDAELSRSFFPIVFAEESYEVATAGEFWLECLIRLADQAPHNDDAPDLHRTLEDLRTIRDDQALGERCLAALLDFSDREGKRLVLLVENLNMMFADITDRDVGWQLRQTLQTEPRIVLLASATSRFDEIDRPDHALYDLFRTLTLHPLDTEECAALWEAVSGQSRPRGTIRSLEILTGGSPRLLAIVARFGAGFSFRDLMNNLLELVDDHTEYFKGHLESLPPQERRVYLALADLWKPALTKEIADRARLSTSQCSAQLKRLSERGAILVAGGSARRKLYYVTERLYNIYYLLRRDRGANRLIDALIQFMAVYYSPDELHDIGSHMVSESKGTRTSSRSLQELAYAKLIAIPASTERQAEVADAVRSTEGERKEVIAAKELFQRCIALREEDRMDDALSSLDELVDRFRQSKIPLVLEIVAKAMVNKGVILGALGRPEAELLVYEEVLNGFEGLKTSRFLEPVARALVNKASTLGEINRPEEALAASEKALRMFSNSEVPDILEHVAAALVNKGTSLSILNRPEEELDSCDEVISRFGDSEVPTILWRVAMALVNKGSTLSVLQRPEEALAAYNEVLRRFGEGDAPELLEQVAMALVNKGIELRSLGRLEEALATYDEILSRHGESTVPEFLEHVAKALLNKVVTLQTLGRPEEALAASEEVLRRFGGTGALNRLDHAAKALTNTLMKISVGLGPELARDMVQASPAADLLLPLTTALEQEMGLAPRVAREVEEVAEDIRQRLATMK